ncbi:MAG: phosphoribosylformylglycinamidine cyclo-ligase [candidate division WOR-3 bacterium]
MLYRDAGVDIDAMDAVKRAISHLVRPTYTPQVLSEIGLFGSLFRLPTMRRPVLVASCDSVGTKVEVARMMDRYDTVGIDIVNHSINDILTLGARPLFFLDYIGHGRLTAVQLGDLVRGLVRACRAAGCALVGGEIAMMPDVYRDGDYDLVGFVVGAVEQSRLVNPRRLRPGDWCIGIPSTGLHTNGYTLARRILFSEAGLDVSSRPAGLRDSLGRILLRPHRCYLKLVYPLLGRVKALAHITGGGFYDNIRRLLPTDMACIINRRSWRPPAIFRLIQKLGAVPEEEMYRTFNMGMGMVLMVAPNQAKSVLSAIPGARPIGRLVRGSYGVVVV